MKEKEEIEEGGRLKVVKEEKEQGKEENQKREKANVVEAGMMMEPHMREAIRYFILGLQPLLTKEEEVEQIGGMTIENKGNIEGVKKEVAWVTEERRDITHRNTYCNTHCSTHRNTHCNTYCNTHCLKNRANVEGEKEEAALVMEEGD